MKMRLSLDVANHNADEAEYPDEQQGIIIRTRKHKTAEKMEAITFLSLVDLMLMDAYCTITRKFIGSEAFDLQKPLFINRDKKVSLPKLTPGN